jgi:magnesium-transporting ATPase (P-type)
MVRYIKAWTWQAVCIYLLAEFAIFTICSRLMHLYLGRNPQVWWVEFVFYFLPLTISAMWVMRVVFKPRAVQVDDASGS